MKILSKICEKNTEGEISLLIENTEDLWSLYNLIIVGDKLSCTTTRKVVKETGTSTQSNKVKIFLSILVAKIDFEPQAESIRVSGKIVNENKYVKVRILKKRKLFFKKKKNYNKTL
jgi:protein pelota